MPRNLLFLCIIIAGLAYTVSRYFKTKNPGQLTFLAIWLYLGWAFFTSHSPSLPLALVLLSAAVLARKFGRRPNQKEQTTGQETEKEIHPTNSASSSEAEVTNDSASTPKEAVSNAELEDNLAFFRDMLDDKKPNELPYSSIHEIDQKQWAEMTSHVKNSGLSNEEANVYMWGYLYRLHSWYCINLGDGMQPYAGVVEGRPSLVFFTSPTIAAEYIERNNIKERQEEVGVAGFLLPGTLAHIQSYENHGLEWVCFNPGPEGSFGGPINLLRAGYQWHLENDSQFKKRDKE